ncbi:uncharacterized protein KQ657_005047 [Scheffersomyces spartinae]|uniref:HPt domain-containing protein n=1 Tax=Scheffersomyces spartinae TaxID=45513 RepID=A0A9P7V9L8_9ASCO|nr:uncharacterized protein KQ657_005047 [Scheffersomyces spartinae]KAG7193849.1 hypothetical protein KQ657_005047 [Scheffersomyces spartinae]
MPEQKKQKLQDTGLVEWSVFSELVAMDEDEEGFSKNLFVTFVDQFKETFEEIEYLVRQRSDLEKLSSLGHYLKGSAAALGLNTISIQCERIQNYGKMDNFDHFELSKDLQDDTPIKDKENEQEKEKDVKSTNKQEETPDDKEKDNDDQIWFLLIKDACEKAKDGFEKLRAALNDYFDGGL